jgi:chaperone modulatory protein CbpM
MTGFDEMAHRFAELDAAELARWVENRWVLPEREGEGFLFREVDVARVELILEIRREYTIDDDSLALVLGLLDQVYSLRRQMRRLCDALECQPAEIQDAIRRALPAVGGRDDS